jgi:hypothetical protein
MQQRDDRDRVVLLGAPLVATTVLPALRQAVPLPLGLRTYWGW